MSGRGGTARQANADSPRAARSSFQRYQLTGVSPLLPNETLGPLGQGILKGHLGVVAVNQVLFNSTRCRQSDPQSLSNIIGVKRYPGS